MTTKNRDINNSDPQVTVREFLKAFVGAVLFFAVVFALKPLSTMAFRHTENTLSVKDFYKNYESCYADNVELELSPERYEAVLSSLEELYAEYARDLEIKDSFMEVEPEFRYTPGMADPWIRVWYILEGDNGEHVVKRVDTSSWLATDAYAYMSGETDEFPVITQVMMEEHDITPTFEGGTYRGDEWEY